MPSQGIREPKQEIPSTKPSPSKDPTQTPDKTEHITIPSGKCSPNPNLKATRASLQGMASGKNLNIVTYYRPSEIPTSLLPAWDIFRTSIPSNTSAIIATEELHLPNRSITEHQSETFEAPTDILNPKPIPTKTPSWHPSKQILKLAMEWRQHPS